MWSSLKRMLGMAPVAVVSGTVAVYAQTLPYPDRWEAYLGERSGHPAMILYNVGIGEVLEALPEDTLLTVTIPFRLGSINGIPTPEEGKFLYQLDDNLAPILRDFKAHDLGRVSTQGARQIYILAGDRATDLADAIVRAARKLNYDAVYTTKSSEAGAAYANILTPTPDEKRLIGDQSVLRQLADNGDVATIARKVDHWAYFPTRASADNFADWASKAGFEEVRVEKQDSHDLPFLVKSTHTGTMLPEDILERTRSQDKEARALEGTYDGWETLVMR